MIKLQGDHWSEKLGNLRNLMAVKEMSGPNFTKVGKCQGSVREKSCQESCQKLFTVSCLSAPARVGYLVASG